MSITESFEFDKDGEVVKNSPLKPFFLGFVIILVALLAFGIGRLSVAGGQGGGVKIEYDPSLVDQQPATTTLQQPILNSASVFASSKGTKYYFPNCKSTISAANKVTFMSAAEAEKAGYSLATNCKPR